MAAEFFVLQVCLSGVMFLATLVAGFVPPVLLRNLKKKGKDQSQSGWLSYLSCFSGGVFMATCFLDVIPHIGENYAALVENYGLDFPIPLNQLFICCGFFLVYLIEVVTTIIFKSSGHGHSHGGLEPEPKEKITRDVQLHLIGDDNGETIENGHASRRSMAVEEVSEWVVSDEKSNMLKSITFSIAMSFHSLLEGFALGVQESSTGIYTLFFSLLLHKAVESFSVGLQLSKANSEKFKMVSITLVIYSFMTPLGSILGSLLQSSSQQSLGKDGTILFLESLAAGTFIYVTFLEVLATEKVKSFNNLKQIASIMAGFVVILLLQIAFGGHDHSSHSGHSHPQPSPISAAVPTF